MKRIDNHLPTLDLQRLDAAHHLHPFTNGNELNEKGARVITRASGVMLTDSDGGELLDAMAGLWCVNLGYGRKELADAAACIKLPRADAVATRGNRADGRRG